MRYIYGVYIYMEVYIGAIYMGVHRGACVWGYIWLYISIGFYRALWGSMGGVYLSL